MSQDTIPGFADLGLSPAVLSAVQDVGYETPSPIQAATVGPLLAGRDVIGQAQTGTGKTAAFALPLLSRMDLSLAQPQVLVLTPTRELALQVAEAMQTYARHMKGFHVLPVYGGQGMEHQLKQLRRGVHAIVGTPGRIQDHLRRGTLKLDQLRTVVLDEADEMLRMGFIDDVEDILGHMPESRQVALFSATMPPRIKNIADRYLVDPEHIRIQSKTTTVSTISQHFWQVQGVHKLDALTRILEVEDFDAMIVFVRTRTATVELAEKLEARGFASAALSGEMTQVLRQRTVDRLKSGKLDIVVATDVAARGLDVERISHVVNYDIPYDAEAYVHRIGRTGRAGRQGKAILFVSPRERRMLSTIERATRQPIERMSLPTRDEIVNKRSAQFAESITEAIEGQDLEMYKELVANYRSEHRPDVDELLAALVYLAQRERPLVPPIAPEERKVESWQPEGRRGEQRGRPAERRTSEEATPEGSVRYRLAVGHNDRVLPKNIVGAIANEAGLDAGLIGRIRIYDEYSTVDLPEGMPDPVFQQLKKAWVCGKPLDIAEADGHLPGQADEQSASTPYSGARREDRGSRPGGRFGDRPRGDRGDRPKGKFGDRPRGDFGDRPKGKFGDKPRGDSGDRPKGKFGDKPRGDFGDRPKGKFGDKPRGDFGDRPKGKFGDKPRGDFGDRPKGKFGDKPHGKPAAKKPGKKFVGKPTGYTKKRREDDDQPADRFGGKNSKPRKVLTTRKD